MIFRGGKAMFDCKWFIPMNVLKMDTKFAYQGTRTHMHADARTGTHAHDLMKVTEVFLKQHQ